MFAPRTATCLLAVLLVDDYGIVFSIDSVMLFVLAEQKRHVMGDAIPLILNR